MAQPLEGPAIGERNLSPQHKNTNLLLSWSTMVISLCSLPTAATAKAPRTCRAIPTLAARVIDDVLNGACWRETPGFGDFQAPESRHPEQTSGWICYDKQHLYVGVRCYISNVAAYRKRLREEPRSLRSGIRVQIDVGTRAKTTCMKNTF